MYFDTLNDISDNYSDISSEKRSPDDVAKVQKKKAVKQPATKSKKPEKATRSSKPQTIEALRNALLLAQDTGKETAAGAESVAGHASAREKASERKKAGSSDAVRTGQSTSQSGKKDGDITGQTSVERLAASLKQELASTTLESDSGQDTRSDIVAPRPFPSFHDSKSQKSKPYLADQVSVPAGKTRAREGAAKVWKAKTSPHHSGLGAGATRKQPVDGAAWRVPLVRGAWGASEYPRPNITTHLSFDRLRKADSVSPKKHLPSSVNEQPFGMVPDGRHISAANRAGAGGISGLLSSLASNGESHPNQEPNVPGDTFNSDHAGESTSAQGVVVDRKDQSDPALSSLQDLYSNRDAERTEAVADPREALPLDEAMSADPVTEMPTELSEWNRLYETWVRIQRDQKGWPKNHKGLRKSRERSLASKARTIARSLVSMARNLSPASAKSIASILPRLESELKSKGIADTVGSEAETAEPSAKDMQSTKGQLIQLVMKGKGKGKGLADTVGSKAGPVESSTEDMRTVKGQVTGKAAGDRVSRAKNQKVEVEEEKEQAEERSHAEVLSMNPLDIEVKPLDIPQPPVPYLEYGLDRVLFNRGVYVLQDPASRVYNFDPYLEKIMPVNEFDFNALKEYKTSSEDFALAAIGSEQNKRYIGSTSSMTSSLAHFHYLISNWRPLNLAMLSSTFTKGVSTQFTKINRAPSAIFLRYKNGSYAIDADKEYDGANVLMLLGKSMELLLTLPTDDYERYRRSDPRQVSEKQRTAPESYQYTTSGDFLMRSQLDAYDPRLPGNGTFDLKTRAVISVRMQSHDHESMTGYELFEQQGKWASYEREYYDMARATLLKYMLQARMGRMNGIFLAYHNVKRIFGFQYLSIEEMDRILHGQPDASLGDQEFKASIKMMNDLLNKATAKYPERSLRIHFETREATAMVPAALHMFAEPMSEPEIDEIQNKQKSHVAEIQRRILGKDDVGEPVAEKAIPEETTKEDTVEAAAPPLGSSDDKGADIPFLEHVEDRKIPERTKDLFYATVIVQHEVNGAPVGDRPTDLRQGDKWNINYLIKDYEVDAHHWSWYTEMKGRRKQALDNSRDDEDGGDPESDGRSTPAPYIRFLREMSEKAGRVREQMDGLDAGRKIMRVDDPLPRHREKVETLDDYLAWMYRKEQD
jgi:hypothetical protein